MKTSEWSHVQAIAFDFDGVFTDDRVWVSETGEETVVCSRSDGMGIGLLRDAGVHMIIISKERNPVVSARAKKLSLEVIQGCDEKLPEFVAWLTRIGVEIGHSAFMGNDINDLECMRHTGLAIAPGDAHPSAIACARYVTVRPGGNGAIREVADAIHQSREAKQ
jgi:N-acylneuraminate cytidylyltransferase